MIHTPPQHQTAPDKLPGQVVNADYRSIEERVTAHEVAYWRDRKFGSSFVLEGTTTGRIVSDMPVYAELPRSGPAIYKPAHGGYPGEVKAR